MMTITIKRYGIFLTRNPMTRHDRLSRLPLKYTQRVLHSQGGIAAAGADDAGTPAPSSTQHPWGRQRSAGLEIQLYPPRVSYLQEYIQYIVEYTYSSTLPRQ